jgi:hypothetical protein
MSSDGGRRRGAPAVPGDQCDKASLWCHRPVTTLQQRRFIMQASHRGDMRYSRASAGSARPPRPWIGGREGSGKPVAHRAPGGMRKAGWPPACHHLVSCEACCWREPDRSGRASVGDGGWPATIGRSGHNPGQVPAVSGRGERVDALSRAWYSDTPVGTAPQGPPAAEGDSPASSGAVLWHTRHQHRLDWCVPGRSLKTE